ncbi:MAG TPA: ester cyclase [Burkholderiaceae bacterium]|nr:ester cyclase [Burkholderiaceae bacterium]
MSTTYNIAENKNLVRKFYEECINIADLDSLRKLISDDFVVSPGEKGADDFVNSIAAVLSGFPNVQFQIDDLFAEGDRVAVRWIFHATHNGTFSGVTASNAQVTQTGNVIFQIGHGKITRAWAQVDRLGLLQQIGGQT